MTNVESTPPRQSRTWIWILGGCVVLIIGIVAVVVGAFYWGQRKLVSMAEEQTNPQNREQNAKQILGATTLPPGYYAGINLSMGIVRTARLSDRSDTNGYDKRGFFYNESLRTTQSDVDDYLAGKSGNVLDEMGCRVRTDEKLRDAEIEVNGRQIHYYVRRGEVSESDIAVPALMTVMTFTCPDDRERWAVWFQREPPAKPTPDIELEGSVGDENAIREFLAYFNVCGKS